MVVGAAVSGCWGAWEKKGSYCAKEGEELLGGGLCVRASENSDPWCMEKLGFVLG